MKTKRIDYLDTCKAEYDSEKKLLHIVVFRHFVIPVR